MCGGDTSYVKLLGPFANKILTSGTLVGGRYPCLQTDITMLKKLPFTIRYNSSKRHKNTHNETMLLLKQQLPDQIKAKTICHCLHIMVSFWQVNTTPPQPFYGPFSGTLGELVPEENFWTLWCKGRLTEADTPTIRLGATPSRLTSVHLHHPSLHDLKNQKMNFRTPVPVEILLSLLFTFHCILE